MDIPVLSMQDVMVALLIFMRVSAMMLLIPVLGHKIVPSQVKAGLIALVTILLYPVVSADVPKIEPNPIFFVMLGVQELVIAGMLALLAQLIFAGVQFAGQLMSFQMGMAMANVFDPATSASGAVTAQMASVLAMLIWLSIGAHHIFIMAMVDSFTLLPIGHSWSFAGWGILNDAAANMFVLALKLVAPVMLLLFFVYVALGLVSRAVPQIQVFFVSFPLTVGLGLLVFALSLPAFLAVTMEEFQNLEHTLPYFLRTLSGV